MCCLDWRSVVKVLEVHPATALVAGTAGVVLAGWGATLLAQTSVPWLLFPVAVVALLVLAVGAVAVPLVRVWTALDHLYALADQAAEEDVWVVPAATVARVVESVVPRHDAQARRDRWADLRPTQVKEVRRGD